MTTIDKVVERLRCFARNRPSTGRTLDEVVNEAFVDKNVVALIVRMQRGAVTLQEVDIAATRALTNARRRLSRRNRRIVQCGRHGLN